MAKKEYAKVLCLMDYHTTTGFGIVSHQIVKALRKHFEQRLYLDICAINYFGEPFQQDPYTYVFSAQLTETNKDPFGRTIFCKVLQNEQYKSDGRHLAPKDADYDGIFVLQDCSVAGGMVPVLERLRADKLKQNRKSFKSVLYFPVDSKMFPALTHGLWFYDKLITYTEFGRREVERVEPKLRRKLSVIYHGTDTDTFKPLTAGEMEPFRAEYFGSYAEDKAIILNINRNQHRKDIITTILAFEALRKKRSDVFLYLHMDPHDPMGHNLKVIMEQTSLVEFEDYMFPPGGKCDLSPETLNLIYNSADIFLTTTAGGGWELTVTEAMAAKLPVLCPNHTSLTEIAGADIFGGGRIRGRARLLHESEMRSSRDDSILRPYCIAEEVAEELEDMVAGLVTTEHYDLTEAAYNWVRRHSWKTICKDWIKTFEETYF